MPPLTSAQRRQLRARAHRLHPMVIVGGAGLTEAVLQELARALDSHELIKVKVAAGGPQQREAALQAICARLEAAPVQHIGRILIVYRERPAAAQEQAAAKGPAPRKTAARKPGPARRRQGKARQGR